jgi:uncharacterized membrane protein YjgN (DUF898 family)
MLDRIDPQEAQQTVGAGASAPTENATFNQPVAYEPPAVPAESGFQFSGNGAEYFRIWLTNIAFTVMSLGIYSAWAKVRRVEYVYRNTRLANAHFMYDAQPMAILRGRVIAAILFAVYYFYTELPAWLALVVLALLGCAFPYLMWSGLRFKASRARHRGIRFRFTGTLSGAYSAYVPLMLVIAGPTALALITVGSMWEENSAALIGTATLIAFLFVPWVHARLRRWVTSHSALGQAQFSIELPTRKFYGLYMRTFFVSIGAGIVAVSVSGLLYSLGALIATGRSAPFNYAVVLITLGITYSILIPYFVARLQNMTWQATRLEGVAFDSKLSVGGYVVLTLKNLILTIATLGLWRPFGWIQAIKMRIESVAWLGAPALIASQLNAEAGTTAGSEAAEFFGVDLGL